MGKSRIACFHTEKERNIKKKNNNLLKILNKEEKEQKNNIYNKYIIEIIVTIMPIAFLCGKRSWQQNN